MEVEGASIAVSQQVAGENQVSFEAGNQLKRKQKRKNVKVSLPPNTIREVFLKNIFYLDKDYSKFLVVGYFESYEHRIGLLFKTGKSYVFWSYQTFNDLAVHFDNITSSLRSENKQGYSIRTTEGYALKVKKVFGNLYVSIHDKEHSILLNHDEWVQFMHSLHVVRKHLIELFTNEQLIQLFIDRVLVSEEEDDAVPPEGLPTHITNKLVDDVLFFKKWLVWNQQQ
jgi:hypothetical protein